MKKRFLFCLLYILFGTSATSHAQESMGITPIASLDLFYGYDFNKPYSIVRLPYLYNHNLHNRLAINLGTIGVEAERKRFNSRLIFQAGTYVEQNYASEPELFQLIHEANIKFNLDKKKHWTMDIGILPSHIGLESAIAFDNPTYTRSLVAEQSPYYMNGLKLNYKIKDSLTLSLMALSGWQRIAMVPDNSLPAFGTQLNWQLTENLLLNWSTFAGTVFPDSIRKMRYYSDIYGIWKWSTKSTIYFGLDMGVEQKLMNSNNYNGWFSPLLIVDYAIFEGAKIAARCEYFSDPGGVLIVPEGFKGAKIFGTSLNFDYSFTNFLNYRLEIKLYHSNEDIFTKNYNSYTNNSIFFCGGYTLKF
jgi:hypothetical protein